jgi:hypothetical protein
MGMHVGRLRGRPDPLAVSVFQFFKRTGDAMRAKRLGAPVADLRPALEASLPAWELTYANRPDDLPPVAGMLAGWCLKFGVPVPPWSANAVPVGTPAAGSEQSSSRPVAGTPAATGESGAASARLVGTAAGSSS